MAWFFIVGPEAECDPDVALATVVRALTLTEIEVFRHERGYGLDSVLFTARGPAEAHMEMLRPHLVAGEFAFDVFVADSFPDPGQKGGLVLDMDMTSVQIEGIDEIARRLGRYEEVAAITAAAMHGELDFAAALRERVALLKGGEAHILREIKESMPETPGLKSLMDFTRECGWVRGIASGGFVQLIAALNERYGLDFVQANELELADGRLTGGLVGGITDRQRKAEAVEAMQARHGISRAQTIVLGDGANDLDMIARAGLGIAYHAKPKVVAQAPQILNHADLSAVTLLLRARSGKE